MNWKNTPPSKNLYNYEENSLRFEEFFIFVDDFYADVESQYPNVDPLSHEEIELLKNIVELWIELELLDIEMRNHDFTHYKTVFIILRQFFEKWFFEDIPEIQEQVFSILQKYTALCERDTSSLEKIQSEYHRKLENAQFREENDFLRAFVEQEIEFFLSIIHSEVEIRKGNKRFQSFLSLLSEKEIIDSDQYKSFWNNFEKDGLYNLFFLLLEKDSLWEKESDLRYSVWILLREYFFTKDTWKYNALKDYDQGFEYHLHTKSDLILEVLVKKQVYTSTEIIDTFLYFLYENEFFSAEEYQYYLSNDNMPDSLCEIMYKIILGKYLSEYPEHKKPWVQFLISYAIGTKNQKKIKNLQMYAECNQYSISLKENYSPTELKDFLKASDAFHHFLNIAMDLPDRISNIHTRDFFEGEGDFLKVLERFYELKYLEEHEFYEFQEIPFENSIYRLLKKLYFEWFFSGDITQVERVKNTLLAIAELISPDEIWELEMYFKNRYDSLIEKERRTHIFPLAMEISEILQEGNEKDEAHLIWDFMQILEKYDSSGNIKKLSGYGNSPRLVWFECLHFALTHGFLGENWELIQKFYYQTLGYYRENNFSKRLEELQKFSQSLQEKWYSFVSPAVYEVMHWMLSLLKKIELGLYGSKEIELIEKLVYSLFSQSLITEKERNVILTSKNSPAAFLNLYTILWKNWFLSVNEKIEARIQKIRNVSNQILDEVEKPTQEDQDLFWDTPGLRDEMLRLNTFQLLKWIKSGETWKLDDAYFEGILTTLWTLLSWDCIYSEYFQEEPEDIVNIENKEERSHALLLYIYCDFLEEDIDTMEQVYLCLKEYYVHNQKLCEIIDGIIYPYRISNSNN